MPNWFDEWIEDSAPVVVGETTPPSASAIFPASHDYGVARDGSVSIPIVDAASSVGLMVVAVQFGNTTPELIYLGTGLASGFKKGYSLASTIAGNGSAGVGYTLSIRRDSYWPRGAPARFIVQAADSRGNVLS